jgi:hypothetical protein
MKRSAILIAMLANFTFATTPETHLLPENEPTKCEEYKSLYYQYLINGMFEDARTFWLKAYSNCDGVDEKDSIFYNNGIFIYNKLLEKYSDEPLKRENHLDSMEWIFNNYIEAVRHPQVILDYSKFLLDHERSCEKQTELFYSIHEIKGDASATTLQRCFKSFILCEFNPANADQKDSLREKGIHLMFDLLVYSNMAMIDSQKTANEIDRYQQSKNFLVKYGARLKAKCDWLVPLIELKMSMLPKELTVGMTKDMIRFMEKARCTESTLYLNLLEEILKEQPTFEIYVQVGNGYYDQKNYQKSLAFYELGIPLVESDSLLNELNYRMALAKYSSKDYMGAFKIAKDIKGIHEVEALLMCAQIIALRANECGQSTFDRKANFWLANDYVLRAWKIDPTIDRNQYLDHAPDKPSIFQNNHQVGEDFFLKCWGVSTSIR